MIIALLILTYLILVILTYGMGLAYAARFDGVVDRDEKGFNLLIALLSPVSTILVFFLTGFAEYGLKFK